jgi:hypothetical protein
MTRGSAHAAGFGIDTTHLLVMWNVSSLRCDTRAVSASCSASRSSDDLWPMILRGCQEFCMRWLAQSGGNPAGERCRIIVALSIPS